MDQDLSNAYAFGALLRENPKAGNAYENCSPDEKQRILLKISSANQNGILKIVSSLAESAR